MKIECCPNCGFINTYVNLTKQGVPKICYYCFMIEKRKINFTEFNVDFSKEIIRCSSCKSIYMNQKTLLIPPFYNVLTNTFYCGCLDITKTLKSNNITEFIEFIHNSKKEN